MRLLGGDPGRLDGFGELGDLGDVAPGELVVSFDRLLQSPPRFLQSDANLLNLLILALRGDLALQPGLGGGLLALLQLQARLDERVGGSLRSRRCFILRPTNLRLDDGDLRSKRLEGLRRDVVVVFVRLTRVQNLSGDQVVFQTKSLELGVAFNLRNLRLALDPIALRFGSLELLLRLGNLRLRAELGRLGVVAGVCTNFLRLRFGVVGSFLRLRHRLLDVRSRRLRV